MIYVNTELRLRVEGSVSFPANIYSNDGSPNEPIIRDFAVHAEKSNRSYDVTDILDPQIIKELEEILIKSEWERKN